MPSLGHDGSVTSFGEAMRLGAFSANIIGASLCDGTLTPRNSARARVCFAPPWQTCLSRAQTLIHGE
jgi:hypothetical protein